MCLRARFFVYVFVGLIHLFARTAYVDAVVDRGGVGDDTRLGFGEAIRMCWGRAFLRLILLASSSDVCLAYMVWADPFASRVSMILELGLDMQYPTVSVRETNAYRLRKFWSL